VLRHTLLLAGGLALALAAVGFWALPLVYGRVFSPAVAPLLILLPGSVCAALVVGLSSYLTYQLGRPHVLSLVGVGAVAVYLPLAWLATRSLGVAGAALASTAISVTLAAALLVAVEQLPGLRAADILRFTREDVRAYATLARSLASGGTRW
jgi:O-antigen/teichoic acid export membrane protein